MVEPAVLTSKMEDFFETSLANIAAGQENDSQLVKSIATTEYFRKLSVYIAQVVPDLLGKYVLSDTQNDTRIQKLLSLMSDVEDVEDSESILSFFSKYHPFLKSAITLPDSNVTSSTRALIDYLEKQLSQDLILATHLDVSDLANALKKGTLTKLSQLAQKIHGDLLHMKQLDHGFTAIVQAKVSKYEWVCKLMSKQDDIAKYLKIGKERALDDSERSSLARLIGMDSLSDHNCKAALKVLGSRYGVAQYKIQGPPDHAIITVSAANLSLRDIIGDSNTPEYGHTGKPSLTHLLDIRKLMGKSNTAPKELERYGDIECKAEEKSKHVTITVRATTLALHDLLIDKLDEDEDHSHSRKEVRFICTECFYLDASLNCKQSTVSNVAIIAPKVIVVGDELNKRAINVSGSDGKSFPDSSRASDGKESFTYGPGDFGKNGENGGPGESGGNILICTDKIENSQFLVLSSDGGKGGDGQGGGNGQDGKAKPSMSDDLRHFGGYEKLSVFYSALAHKIYSGVFEHCYSKDLSISKQGLNSEYAYGVSPDGVQILFGNYNATYAFLYSRGVNGVSADGGDAGKGGKGGGGGKDGHVDILKKNGIDRLHDHKVVVSSRTQIGSEYRDGKAGKPGRPGKKDVAECRRDYLICDGLWKSVLRYGHDKFINALPYTGKDPKRLERGWYYCEPSVAKCFDPMMTSGCIEFFEAERGDECPTEKNEKAENGKDQKKEKSVVQATPSRPINKAEIQKEFRKHSASEVQLQVQDNSSSIQLLEEMQQNINENLEKLESTFVKGQYKQIRSAGLSSDPFPHHSIVARFLPKVVIGRRSFPPEIITKLNENPLVSEHDQFETTSSTEEMFSKSMGIIENNLAKQREEKEKSGLPELDVCKHIYQLMEIALHPTFLTCIGRHRSLQIILDLLNTAEAVTAPLQSENFQKRLVGMRQNVLPRYRWWKLSQVHKKLLTIFPSVDKEFQRIAAALHRQVCSQKSIEDVDKLLAGYFHDGDPSLSASSLSPLAAEYNHVDFQTSCNALLPLSSVNKTALEMLMVFINEANEISNGVFHFPDLIAAIEHEYEAYRSTIGDPDFMFIMTFIQDKLDQMLLDKTQLEDSLCEILLEQTDHLKSFEGGFIFHQEESYEIVSVSFLENQSVQVTSHHDQIFEISLQNSTATLNKEPIKIPEALLVSKLNIHSIWKEIETALIKSEAISDDHYKNVESFLDRLLLPEEEYKHQLVLLLQQSCAAQETHFDVFAFHPPSHWVEMLIVSSVRKQFSNDNRLIAEIRRRIDGLSQCYDKSLYWTMYTQFLQENSQMRVHTFETELLEVLDKMRSLFIEQDLCSVVTEQGMIQSGIEDAEYVFSDLVDSQIINSVGAFLPTITEDSIAQYCSSFEMKGYNQYLNSLFNLQQYMGQLSGRGLSFWNHKLGELCLRFSLQQLTGGDDSVCDKLIVHIYQMQRHYGEQEVLDFIELVSSKIKSKFPRDKLMELFSKCSSKEWIFSIVKSKVSETSTRESRDDSVSPLLQALDDLHSFDWKSQQDRARTATEIIAGIKSDYSADENTEHLFSVLDTVEEQVAAIKKIEQRTSQFEFDIEDEQLREELNTLHINQYAKHHIDHWTTKFKTSLPKDKSLKTLYMMEAFAVIRTGITLFYNNGERIMDASKKVLPRDTQMVACLLFFQDLSSQGAAQGTKLLQQISTGEGKTMILCMAAIYKALLGEKVDIVTSSSVLATRDADKQQPLYDFFDVTVSHCCHEELTKRKSAYGKDVIYGDIGSFQRDILETSFYCHDIRTERGYDNVFVDEVDSMLVDKGQNMLYLPHALPDMNCLDQIFLEIWSLVNARDFLGLEQEQEQLHIALKRKVLGALAPNSFTAISGITEKQSHEIFNSLIKHEVVDSKDHCLVTMKFSDIMSCVDVHVKEKHIQNEVLMIIQQHIEAKPLIETIPKALHHYVKKSLQSWIHSAVCAKYFRPNKEYIIDIDRRESASDRYPKVIIMDNETGVEQESSEWGNGLHQFLQLKHNLRLSVESLKAVYMSNISFFTRYYHNIMGVTGTLGSEEEHALFKKLYQNTLLVKVPTNKPRKIIIELPVCCSTKEEWEEAMKSDVEKKLERGRTVLLICEDVEAAKHVQKFMKSMSPILYFSSHQQKLEEKPSFRPGPVIIATNIAGRGTDIKLTDEVKRNGGLHVCLSYLPPNVRVEFQAYGRAARSGDPGSCRMIFHNEEADLSYAIQKRNSSEAYRVTEIEADYFLNIRLQEKLFEKFTKLFEQIQLKYKQCANDKADHRAVLDYCLDCWAFFLDRYTDDIASIPEKSPDEAKREKHRITQAFENEVRLEVEKLKDVIAHKLSLPPSRLRQLGHSLMKQELKRGNKYENAGIEVDRDHAVSLYEQATTAVARDPFALYYLAAAKLNRAFHRGKATRTEIWKMFYKLSSVNRYEARRNEEWAKLLPSEEEQVETEQEQEPQNLLTDFISSVQSVTGAEKAAKRALKQECYKLIPMFHHKIRQCHNQATMLQLANRYRDQTETGNFQYFQEQKQHEVELYQQFISSIQDIIGKEITPSIFDHCDWKEDGARVVHEIVFQEFSLKGPHIAKSYQNRLESLLSSNDLYYTFEAKIKHRVKSVRTIERALGREDFAGVVPGKEEFWSLLKKNNLITSETKTPAPVSEDAKDITMRDEIIAYWNPQIDITSVQLEVWDCIDTHSFDWIKGLTDEEKRKICSLLKDNHIVSGKGQLMDLDLAKPLDISLPDSCAKHYKAIKDTLWHHSIYRFILDHLSECAEIDTKSDISGVAAGHQSLPSVQKSVVDKLLSLNPDANAPSEGKAKHIITTVFGPLKKSGSKLATFLKNKEEPPSANVPNLQDHYPSQALKTQFQNQLTENGLQATPVSGHGLNCFINAIIQHAKQDYFTPTFQEADIIRESTKRKYPDLNLSGMLHCDDKFAADVLACVNDMFCSEIGTVSAFIASSDGPILHRGTTDQRFTSGRHVATWQQGNHFVAIVHHQELVETSQGVKNDDSEALDEDVPMIRQPQLKLLKKLKIVSPTSHGKCRILKPVEEIESILKSRHVSAENRNQMIKFLRFKLEVDYKTLSNSPRELASDQTQVLYDDLYQYAVIKQHKMRKAGKEIDEKCSSLKIEDSYWYKDLARLAVKEIPFYFSESMMCKHFKHKKIETLTSEQFQELQTFLRRIRIIDEMIAHVRNQNFQSAVDVIRPKYTKVLTPNQTKEVKNFVLLMLQVRSNASFITSTLKSQQSVLLDLETPEVSLRSLADLFHDTLQDKEDVVSWFSNNHCHLVMNLAEKRWSLKSVVTAVCIIAMGVAQITLGAVLMVATAGAGSFLCSGLISEGVSDMIFGIEGLVRGHCNWSQYYDHKKMSIAITIATAGIGAYLGRGVQASRYAYKAFGNASKKLAEAAGKNLGKIMAKQVGKKIVKKCAGATADAVTNLVIDHIVEKLSPSLDNLSQCILETFEKMTNDSELRQKAMAFLQKQENPEKAEKYLHQIFTRVMERQSFLEIWDYIEGKLRTFSDVATQAYGKASKHRAMAANIKMRGLRGKGLMKGVGYATRFAPLITEPIKIGLVWKKMELLMKNLITDLSSQVASTNITQPLDGDVCETILKGELKGMKEKLSEEISKRGKTVVTATLQIVGQEFRKHTTTWGKEVVVHKIGGFVDMTRLERHEYRLKEARVKEDHAAVAKYERKLCKLMSRTRSPKVFAHMIEHHGAQLGPAFAIPALEKLTGRPIELVSEDRTPLLNVQDHHASGEPLVIKFIPGNQNHPWHYYVGGESFSVDQHGNNCLIHAAMKGAGISDYSATDIRKKIAKSCTESTHPCFTYIRSGIARNYVEIGLIPFKDLLERKATKPHDPPKLEKDGTPVTSDYKQPPKEKPTPSLPPGPSKGDPASATSSSLPPGLSEGAARGTPTHHSPHEGEGPVVLPKPLRLKIPDTPPSVGQPRVVQTPTPPCAYPVPLAPLGRVPILPIIPPSSGLRALAVQPRGRPRFLAAAVLFLHGNKLL